MIDKEKPTSQTYAKNLFETLIYYGRIHILDRGEQ